MPLPSSLTVITLRCGTYYKSDGSYETGKIFVYSDTVIQSTVDNAFVGPLNFAEPLNSFGYVEIPVPACNDPQWAPLNYTYHVKEVLSTGVRSYYIMVPYDSPGGILEL